MNLFGKIIVIKRNGTDGAHFPLTANSCLFGRGLDCDIRIQLPSVENQQCQITIDEKGHVFMKNLSSSAPTLLNDKAVSDSLIALSHGDVITIIDRQFRFEFPANSRFYPKSSLGSKSPKSPKNSVAANQTLKSPRSSGRVSLPKPLSPRTDNVPEHDASPKSGKKSPLLSKSPALATNNNNAISPIKSTAVSLTMPPSSFYKVSGTPKGPKRLSYVKVTPGPAVPSTVISPALQSQKNGGSPYPKGNTSLRKSIGDLRRRSMPLFEMQEDDSKIPASVKVPKSPLPFNVKRKSVGLIASSIRNSKRVSFGPSLSPEHFDQYLPPKTPVKKGATPSRLNQGRKSLLKRNSPKRITPRKSTSPKRLSTEANIGSPNSKASLVSKQTMTPTVGDDKKSPSTKASPPSVQVDKNVKSPLLLTDDNKSQPSTLVNLKSETSTLLSPGLKSASPTSIAKSVLQTPNSTPLSHKKGKDTISFSPRSSKKKLASDSCINDSIILSQDLFSQMTPVTAKGSQMNPITDNGSQITPVTDKGSQVVEQSAYSDDKMFVKTGRARSDGQNEAWLGGQRANMKRLGVDRAKSFGASPPAHIDIGATSDRHVKIYALSPLGGKSLKKTPIVKRVGRPRKVSDEGQHGKTTGTYSTEDSLVGIQVLLKTPKTQVADISLSGISSLFQSENRSTPNVRNQSTTLNQSKFVDTPRPILSAKRNRSPKTFFDDMSPKSKPKTPKSIPSSQRKSQIVVQVSSPAKIASPPQDFNKVVALRAIHGHAITPKLTFGKRGVTPKNTPKSTKKIGSNIPKSTKKIVSIKKSQVKTWSDIVKLGVPVNKPAIKSISVKTSLIKKTFQVKQSGRTPKTPRALARALAPSTGHADSPATIIVGKKAMGRVRPKTPKPLPRRGRKELVRKISRMSTDDTSFTGLVDMFASPPSDKNADESALYAEIPDTPNGPDEMFVSPLSGPTNVQLRRSVNLSGIRELFSHKQAQSELNLVGIKELMKTPKSNGSEISPTGLKRILKTPKYVSVTPTDLKYLFERNKAKTPVKRGRPSLVSMASEDLAPIGKTTTQLTEIEAVVSSAPTNDLTRRSISTESPKSTKEQAVVIKARGLKRKADIRDEPATKRAKFSVTPIKAQAPHVNVTSTPRRVKKETSIVPETSVVAQIELTKEGRGKAKSSVAGSSESPLLVNGVSPAVKRERSRKKVEFNLLQSSEESGLNRDKGKLVVAATEISPAVSVVTKRKRGQPSLEVTTSASEITVSVVNKTRGKVDKKELSVVKSPITKRKRGRPSLEVATSVQGVDAAVVNKTTRGKADNKELSIVKSPVLKRKRGQPSLEVAISVSEINPAVENKTTRGKADNKEKRPVSKRRRGQPSLEVAEVDATVVNKTTTVKVGGKGFSMSKRSVTKRGHGNPAHLSIADVLSPEPDVIKVQEVSTLANKTAISESPQAVKSDTKNKRAKRGQVVTPEPIEDTNEGAVATHKAADLISPKAERSVTKRGQGKAAEITFSTIMVPEQEADTSVVTKNTRRRASKAEKPVAIRKRGRPSLVTLLEPEVDSAVVTKNTRGRASKAVEPVVKRKPGRSSLVVAPPKLEVDSTVITDDTRGNADYALSPKMKISKAQRGRGKTADLPASSVLATKSENLGSSKAEKPVTNKKRKRPSLVTPPEPEVDSAVVTKNTRGKATKVAEPVAKRKRGKPSLVVTPIESQVDSAVETGLKSEDLVSPKAASPVAKRMRSKTAEMSPKVMPRPKRSQAKAKSPLKSKSPIIKQSRVKVTTQTQLAEQGNQSQDQIESVQIQAKSKAQVVSPKAKVTSSKATVQKQSKSKAKAASPKVAMSTRTRRR